VVSLENLQALAPSLARPFGRLSYKKIPRAWKARGAAPNGWSKLVAATFVMNAEIDDCVL
jgi:hypothetical protein